MTASPVIEWRSSTTPYGVLSSGLALSGSGYAGAVPVGTSSTPTTVRLYNNFAAAGGIADATSCVLAVYDDATHSGLAVEGATTGLYMSVQVLDYNGVTTGQDTQYYALGGQTKHAIPVNSGTIGGTGANYVSISVKVTLPATASQGAYTQGIWVEYTSTA